MGMRACTAGLLLCISACAAPPPAAFRSPDPRARQEAAAVELLREDGPQRAAAADLLRREAACALDELEVRDLAWREPALMRELAWRWLGSPTLGASAAEILAPVVLFDERRELVGHLRRVDREGRLADLLLRAIAMTPREEDRPRLLEALPDFEGGLRVGLDSPAAGLVRLGDPAGLRSFLLKLWLNDVECWGPEADPFLPEAEQARRVADVVLALMRRRFPDAAIRDALRALPQDVKNDVHASLAGRLGLREELLLLGEADVPEALRRLADFPGEDSLRVLRGAVGRKHPDPALESLAMLGDPELPARIDRLLAEGAPEDWRTLLRTLKEMRGPLPASPRPLSEQPAPDGEPLQVFADWTGTVDAVLPGPDWKGVQDERSWTALCRQLRRPSAPLDFGRHVALLLIYVDPSPAVMQPFGLQVAGRARGASGTDVLVRRCNSTTAFTAVHHAGTQWRLLVLPRSALPVRVRFEDVSLR